MPTILISGANRGIGLELTHQYAADGWTVHACCRSPENAHDLGKLAATSGGAIQMHLLDVTHGIQRESLAAQLQGEPIDILLNNAGVYGDWHCQDFGKTNPKEWEKTFLINTIAPMQMMEAFADNVATSERKVIANISSKMASMADNSSGGSYLYRSSKAALNAVTMSAARDLAGKGIAVVALHPGWVRTDMGGPNGEMSVEESASALRHNLNALTAADSGRFIDIDGSDIPW
jgi:NAD(P)-dependent dehydrogenase (short-subunit alcohol dehydrogenase family)